MTVFPDEDVDGPPRRDGERPMTEEVGRGQAHDAECDERAASIDRCQGEITCSAETALADAYGKVTAAATRAIVLNFAGLEYMNSSGIGLLVTMFIRANRAGQQLLSCGLSEHYRQIFELTRLSEAIAIHDRGEPRPSRRPSAANGQ